jgi:hypothetical protein
MGPNYLNEIYICKCQHNVKDLCRLQRLMWGYGTIHSQDVGLRSEARGKARCYQSSSNYVALPEGMIHPPGRAPMDSSVLMNHVALHRGLSTNFSPRPQCRCQCVGCPSSTLPRRQSLVGKYSIMILFRVFTELIFRYLNGIQWAEISR